MIEFPELPGELRLPMPSRQSKTPTHAAAILMATLAGGCCCNPFAGLGAGGLGGNIPNHDRNMIPNVFPLGSVFRAHIHTEQTNAEASNFVFNLVDFVGETPHLTPDGKDHLMEIAARMRSSPFPVLIERTPNNANPQLDAERRAVVARSLADLGNPDAEQRTIVAVPYARGLNSYEGEADYYTNFNFRGNNNNNNGNNGNNGGNGGGFGGGGGGFF